MKNGEFDYSLKLTGISWNHSNVLPIRKLKNGDQLCTSDGTFEFSEDAGWVKKEPKANEFENFRHEVRKLVEEAGKRAFADVVKGNAVLTVTQKDVGEPPTLGRLLKLPDDSLYLYIGTDKEDRAESAGATLVSDIRTDIAGLGLITFEASDPSECAPFYALKTALSSVYGRTVKSEKNKNDGEHVCSYKSKGNCKDAEKNDKDKKDSEKSKKDNVLAGTVDGMLSDDYKERFIAEYVQLSERLSRMDALIKKMGTSDATCDFDLNLFIRQLDAMVNYQDILKKRAVIEKIDLPKCTAAEKFAVPTIRFV